MKSKSRADSMRKTDLSDPLGLASLRGRLKLLYLLRSNGFYVRMHAYEYIIGDGRKFVAILLLEPSRRSATVIKLSESVEQVVRVLREVDPGLSVEVVSTG